MGCDTEFKGGGREIVFCLITEAKMLICYKCEYIERRVGITYCEFGLKINKEEGECILYVPIGTFPSRVHRLNFIEEER